MTLHSLHEMKETLGLRKSENVLRGQGCVIERLAFIA